jgi:O-antigen ligase
MIAQIAQLRPEPRSKVKIANRLVLTAVFTLSFVSYLTSDLSLALQFAPVVLFVLLVIFTVFFSASMVDAMELLFAPESLLFVFFLSLLLIPASLASDVSLVFSLLLGTCLVFARLYMAVVPVSEVIEAFFWSGVISVAIFFPLAFSVLTAAIQSLSRFTAFSFHPNLLAFVLAGFLCVMVWKTLTGTWIIKLLAAITGVICCIIIFFTSSRGSIIGITIGCGLAGILFIIHLPKQRRIKASRWSFLFGTAALTTVVFLSGAVWLDDTYDVVDKVLQITSTDRGIDSGLTGRVDKWQETLKAMRDGSWLWGHGIRTSDSMSQLIDNSYVVALYEVGLFPLALICIRFVKVAWQFATRYLVSGHSEESINLVCVLLLTVFLLNNFVARYLFGIGNPYSFLAILLFAAPTQKSNITPELSLSAQNSIAF